MNCQNFESIVNDLSRGALIEATTRESAQRHAKDCQRCAARLADERALSAGLRAVASNSHAVEASPRVEAMLLAAFREQAARARVDAPVVSAGLSVASYLKADAGILTPTADKSWSWSKTFGVATAAAAVAAAFLLLVLLPASTHIWRITPDNESAQSHAGSVASQNLPPQSITTAPTGATLTGSPDNSGSMTSVGSYPSNRNNGGSPRNTGVPRVANRVMMTTPVVYRRPADLKGSSQNSSQTNDVNEVAGEIATDFMALDHGGARFVAGDGGQIVRVELPRSALASFGLPVNHERADERVKADVLMGDDGIARAIRFVR